MKKSIFALPLLLLAVGLILFPVKVKAQMGRGMMGGGVMGSQGGYGQWNYCPYCGSYIGPGSVMGPGMMGRGSGYGPGMMGPGYGPGYGPWYGPQYQQPQEPLNENEAKQMVENYLRSTRNPNLKLGKIIDKDTYFEADIVTKEGSLADKIAINKRTGWMQSIY
jgi:hypothetical protein